MSKLSNQPIKGMLDDFPEDMRLYKWIKNKIDIVAAKNLFEEYDAPVLEPVSLFATKTSEELIKEQSYSFTDKGGRDIILRPEMTPSLARLISQKVKESPKPFRWYSLPKCYRYEQPQKGRLREFRQLNIDLVGEDSIISDWEMLGIILELMSSFSVARDSFVIKFNHRGLVTDFLEDQGFDKPSILKLFKIVDKRDKLPSQIFADMLKKEFNSSQIAIINQYLEMSKLSQLGIKNENLKKYPAQFEAFIKDLGLSDTVKFSPTTVRGLDYYTGLVFEVYQKGGTIKRSLFGGGRYDNLVSGHVNENLSGIGVGMGLLIFTLFLKELNLLPSNLQSEKTCLIALMESGDYPFAYAAKKKLNREGYKTEISLNSGSLKKIFNKAEKKSFQSLTIIGSEEKLRKTIKIKNLKDKTETEMMIDDKNS